MWEVSEVSQVVDVQGRLCKCISFWEHELKAPLPVLEWIRVGYKLPLLKLPSAFHKDNAQSALDNYDFVSDAESYVRIVVYKWSSPDHIYTYVAHCLLCLIAKVKRD